MDCICYLTHMNKHYAAFQPSFQFLAIAVLNFKYKHTLDAVHAQYGRTTDAFGSILVKCSNSGGATWLKCQCLLDDVCV